jgi:hypothetical protein
MLKRNLYFNTLLFADERVIIKDSEDKFQKYVCILTFRHRASSIQDRHFTTLQRRLFIYLINKYISLSDICLTYIIDINNIDNQLDATITDY